MKSRTSFFDKTVLKKDLTRFFPLWALYLIGGLLIMHVLSGFYSDYYGNRAYSIARDLKSLMGPMGIFSACYGFLAAQLLFGDLHNTRLCYGVHALPLRRECWYLSHTAAGLLMGLVPPLVIVLTLIPMMGQFWFTGLLCWAGIALHYLFFFALSVFCMICTGNRFAASAVYGLLNFFSLIARWFAQTIYLPLLPGVRINATIFSRFCPMVELTTRDNFYQIIHQDDCALCVKIQTQGPSYSAITMDGGTHDYTFGGLGGDWGYLWILAAVGIALLGAGLMLYRIRQLERAGDFMAFKPMKPIFLTVYTLCVGGVLFYLAYETTGEGAGYLFFVIGIFIGYFTGRMLLERTLRVFKGKSFGMLGILYAVVTLSLLLTWIDPMGITRRIPKAEKVKAIYLYDGHLSDYQLNNTARIAFRTDVITVTDPEDIEAIRHSHSLMLQEHQTDNFSYSRWFTIQYKLKSGATVTRSYRIPVHGEGWNSVKAYLSKPSYLFGVDTLEQLLQQATNVYCSELGYMPQKVQDALLKALWLDAQAGYVTSNGTSTGQYLVYVEMRVGNQYYTVHFSEEAPNAYPLLKEAQTYPQTMLKYDTLEELIANTYNICVLENNTQLPKNVHAEFLTLLWTDCVNGAVSRFDKFSNGYNIEVQIANEYQSLSLSSDSKCAQWLDGHYPNSK